MPEMLEIYDLAGGYLCTQDRDEFYQQVRDEFARTNRITRMVKVVRLLLMKPDGSVFLQLRNQQKPENPGLVDKTTGGHVQRGQKWNLAMVAELGEELGIPAFVTKLGDLGHDANCVDLRSLAVLAPVGRPVKGLMSVRRRLEGGDFVQPLIVQHYIGYYSGTLQFRDGEASGVLVPALHEVLSGDWLIKPEGYTQDLADMLCRLRIYMRSLTAQPS